MRDRAAALVAGVGLLLLGVLLLLDALDAVPIGLGVAAPVVLAVVGGTLLTSGLTRT